MSSTQAGKQLRDEDAEVTREFEKLVRRELELVGEDPNREGLVRTPARVAKSLRSLTQGYDSSPEEVVGTGVFKEEHDNMMMVRGVEKQNSKTITSALRGAFREDPKTRDEFLRLAHNGRD